MFENEPRCGRPKKNKKPCNQILWNDAVACRDHMTSQEKYDALHSNHLELCRSRNELQNEFDKLNKEFYIYKVKHPETPEPSEPVFTPDGKRMYTSTGEQIVSVGLYSYAVPHRIGHALRAGDVVRIPGNWLFPNDRDVTVTGMGTDYDGILSEIISVQSYA